MPVAVAREAAAARAAGDARTAASTRRSTSRDPSRRPSICRLLVFQHICPLIRFEITTLLSLISLSASDGRQPYVSLPLCLPLLLCCCSDRITWRAFTLQRRRTREPAAAAPETSGSSSRASRDIMFSLERPLIVTRRSSVLASIDVRRERTLHLLSFSRVFPLSTMINYHDDPRDKAT